MSVLWDVRLKRFYCILKNVEICTGHLFSVFHRKFSTRLFNFYVYLSVHYSIYANDERASNRLFEVFEGGLSSSFQREVAELKKRKRKAIEKKKCVDFSLIYCYNETTIMELMISPLIFHV